MNRGAIILCGGRSVRMGRDKATLPFGDETLLARAVRTVGQVVAAERIVCVAAAGQELPALPDGVRVVRDAYPNAGPLGGLATGLAAIGTDVDAVFACGCDAPLLSPAFVSRLFERLGDAEVAVPQEGDQLHPLVAVYRTGVLSQAQSLLTAREQSLLALVQRCESRVIATEVFRDIDPQLDSLVNCNTIEDYERALAQAFPVGNCQG
jgi:molybdenum cofactor guanylyltransferase